MATLHVRVPGKEAAFHNRHELPLSHYVTKVALLVVVLVSFVSAVNEASAACSYKSLDNLPPLTRSGAIPMTVVFGPSDVSNRDEAILRFEKAMESTKPKILEAAGDVKTLTFDEETEVEEIYRRGTGNVTVPRPHRRPAR